MARSKFVLYWTAFLSFLSGGQFFGEVGAFTREDFRNQQLQVETTLILASAIQDDVAAAVKVIKSHLLLKNPSMLEEKLSLQRIENSFLARASSTTWIASSMTQYWCKVSGNELLLHFLRQASDKLRVYDMIPDILALKKYLDDNDLQINMPKTYAICTNSDRMPMDEVQENPLFNKTSEIPTVLESLNKFDSIYVTNLLAKIKSGELITSPKLIGGLMGILTFPHANPRQIDSITMVIQKLLNGEIATGGAIWDENPYKLIANSLEKNIDESNLKFKVISIGRVIDLLKASKQNWFPNGFCRQAINSNLDMNVTFLLERFITEEFLPRDVKDSMLIIKMANDLKILDMENGTKDYLDMLNTKEFKCNPCSTLLTSLLERINRYNNKKEINFNAKHILNYLHDYNAMKGVCESEPYLLDHPNQQRKEDGKFSNGTKYLSNLQSHIQVDDISTLNFWHKNSHGNFVSSLPFKKPLATQNYNKYNSNNNFIYRQIKATPIISQEPGHTQSLYTHKQLPNPMYYNIDSPFQNRNKEIPHNRGMNTNVFNPKNLNQNTSKNPRPHYNLASYHNRGQNNFPKNYQKSTYVPPLPNFLNNKNQLQEITYLIRIPSYQEFLAKINNTFQYNQESNGTQLNYKRPGLHSGQGKRYQVLSQPNGESFYPNFHRSGTTRGISSNTEKKTYYTPSQLIRNYNYFDENRNEQGRPANSDVISINYNPMKQKSYFNFIPIPQTYGPNSNQGLAKIKFRSKTASMEDIHSPDEIQAEYIPKDLLRVTQSPAKMLPPINIQRISHENTIEQKEDQNPPKIDIESLIDEINKSSLSPEETKAIKEYIYLDDVQEYIKSIKSSNISKLSLLKKILLYEKEIPLPGEIRTALEHIIEKIKFYTLDIDIPEDPEGKIEDDGDQNYKDSQKKYLSSLFILVNKSAVGAEIIDRVKDYIIESPVYEEVLNILAPNASRATILKNILLLTKQIILTPQISSMIDDILDNISFEGPGALPPVILEDEPRIKLTKNGDTVFKDDINEAMIKNALEQTYPNFRGKIDFNSLLTAIKHNSIDSDALKLVTDYVKTSNLYDLLSEIYQNNLSDDMFLLKNLQLFKMIPLSTELSEMIDAVKKNIIIQGSNITTKRLSSDIYPQTEEEIDNVPPYKNSENEKKISDNRTEKPFNTTNAHSTFDFKLMKRNDIAKLLRNVNVTAIDNNTMNSIQKILLTSPAYEFLIQMQAPNISRALFLKYILLFAKLNQSSYKISPHIDNVLASIIYNGTGSHPLPTIISNDSNKIIDVASLFDVVDKNLITHTTFCTVKNYIFYSPLKEMVLDIYKAKSNRPQFLRTLLRFTKMISSARDKAIIDEIEKNIIFEELDISESNVTEEPPISVMNDNIEFKQ